MNPRAEPGKVAPLREKASLLLVAYDYMAMFKPFLTMLPDEDARSVFQTRIDGQLTFAKRVLKKQNRIVWYLTWFRAALVKMAVGMLREQHQTSPELVQYEKKLRRELPSDPPSMLSLQQGIPNSLEHFYSLGVPAIDNLDLKKQSPDEVVEQFRVEEERFIAEAKDTLVPREDDSIFINCGGGWTWWFLPRAYDQDESRCMGHCGNSPESGRSDRAILSLRQKTVVAGRERWEPHLTFILHTAGDVDEETGTIGEMKGKGNAKPVARYFPMIMQLLKDRRIKGITGGGYLPAHNFAFKDLTSAQQEEVREANPDAAWTVRELLERGGADFSEMARRLNLTETIELPDGGRGYVIHWWDTVSEFARESGYDNEGSAFADCVDGALGFFSQHLLNEVDPDPQVFAAIARQINREFNEYVDPESLSVVKEVIAAIEGIDDDGESETRKGLEAAFRAGRGWGYSDATFKELLESCVHDALQDAEGFGSLMVNEHGRVVEYIKEEDLPAAVEGTEDGAAPDWASPSMTICDLQEDLDEPDYALDILASRFGSTGVLPKVLEQHGQTRLFDRPESEEQAKREGITVAKLLRKAAPTQEGVVTLAPGTKLYRGVGEEKILPARAGFDGCLWVAESPTMARTYIPTAGLCALTGLSTLCEPPSKNGGDADIQKQLGFEYTDINYKDGVRAQSYRAPKLFDQLMQDSPRPARDDFPADEAAGEWHRNDTYYDALHAWERERTRRVQEYVMTKLRELGYEPDKCSSDPKYWRYDLKIEHKDGHEIVLPNKNQEGTLLVFEPTQPLRIFDMTEGGRKDGDLMEPDYEKVDTFKDLAEQGYDGVRINDFAQAHGEGNVGHTAIGIFPKAVAKLQEVERQTATHPEDLWEDIKKYGKGETNGEVYLLHFNIPPGELVPSSREDAKKPFHARHYLGWAEDADKRTELHAKGQSGVPLMNALHARGYSFTVARTWHDVDRAFERRLKTQGGLSRHCPICEEQGLIPMSRRVKTPAQSMAAGKTAFISPCNAELTVTIQGGTRSKVTVDLDLGIPACPRFAISVPTTELSNEEIDSYTRQAFEVLLDQVTAFLISMEYDEKCIEEAASEAQTAFLELGAGDATDAKMPDHDPNVRMYEVKFLLPEGFVDQTRDRVIMAKTAEGPMQDQSGMGAPSDIAETPAFKAWFNGSKVVDDHGRPLRVYHATQADIGEFHAFTHFGTQEAANDRFRDTTYFYDNVIKNPARSAGSNIVPVYLAIKNPLRLPDLASIGDDGQPLDQDPDDDYSQEGERFPRGWEGDEAIATTLLEEGYIDIDEFENCRDNEAALGLLATKGYDGIVYRNVIEDPGSDSWITFRPNQIKSAIGNSGDFDPASASITASEVKRVPRVREMILTPVPVSPPESYPENVVQFYADQVTKSTPRPFQVEVHNLPEEQRERGPLPQQWEERAILSN